MKWIWLIHVNLDFYLFKWIHKFFSNEIIKSHLECILNCLNQFMFFFYQKDRFFSFFFKKSQVFCSVLAVEAKWKKKSTIVFTYKKKKTLKKKLFLHIRNDNCFSYKEMLINTCASPEMKKNWTFKRHTKTIATFWPAWFFLNVLLLYTFLQIEKRFFCFLNWMSWLKFKCLPAFSLQ